VPRLSPLDAGTSALILSPEGHQTSLVPVLIGDNIGGEEDRFLRGLSYFVNFH
jgi:hypothetical protein